MHHKSGQIHIPLRPLIVFLIIVIIILSFALCLRWGYDPFPKSAAKVKAATVMVLIDGYYNGGSGVIIDKRGYVITAKHIFEVDDPDYHKLASEKGFILLKDRNGFETKVNVQSIKNIDLERKDVILLKFNPDGLEFNVAKIANKKEISSVGTEVGFVGHSVVDNNGLPFLFVNKGIISNLDTNLQVEGQTDAFYGINGVSTPGYSGGPVFIANNGDIIGIVKMGGVECIKKTGTDVCGTTGIVIVPHIHEVPDIINQLELK